MRIVWKDSGFRKAQKPFKYRGYMVEGAGGNGWTVSIPNDNNIYRTHYCAQNAIDKALGGNGQKGTAKRQAYGIEVIGKKSG